MIDWNAFTWQAFATLVAAGAALFAALIIGLRQTKISAQQLDLLTEQAKINSAASDREHRLKAQTLRLQLLERRIVIVEEVRRLWTLWTQHATLEPDDWNALRNALHQAQLLYSLEISQDIETALSNLLRQRRHQQRAHDYGLRGLEDQASEHLEISFLADDEVLKVMQPLLEKVILETRIDH